MSRWRYVPDWDAVEWTFATIGVVLVVLVVGLLFASDTTGNAPTVSAELKSPVVKTEGAGYTVTEFRNQKGLWCTVVKVIGVNSVALSIDCEEVSE